MQKHQSQLMQSFLIYLPMTALVSSDADNPALFLQFSDVVVYTVDSEAQFLGKLSCSCIRAIF